MRAAIFALSAALLAVPAAAQQPAAAPEDAAAAPQTADDARVNQLIIYGDDPCPQSTGDEIIVCARLAEDDRFRIPTNLRDDPNDPVNQSWANRAIELSYVGRSGIGSCSPSGAGGMIGCFNQMVQEARAERRAAGDVNWTRMIEQAREERMRRISESEQEEAAQEQQPDQPQD